MHESAVSPSQGHLTHRWYGTLRARHRTCRWCTEPTAGFEVCRHCRHHCEIPGVADVVAPLAYAIAGTDSAALLRDYKNHPSRVVRRRIGDEIASMLEAALGLHEDCVERAVGMPVAVRTTVPSLTLRPGVHPFAELAHDVTTVRENLLTAAPRADCHRIVSPGKFIVPSAEVVAGRHVLVLDDLWTTGSNAQSAALALRAAGAAAVSVLVIGRWLNPSYPPTKAFITGSPVAFDPRRCPLTSSHCRAVRST